MAGETFVFIVDGMARRSARGPGDVDPPMPLVPGLGGTIEAAVELSVRRAGAESHRLEATDGEHAVVIELTDGPTLVLNPATARDLALSQQPVKRGGSPADPDTTVLRMPAELSWGSLEALMPPREAASRGGLSRGLVGKVLVRAIQLVRGALGGELAGLAATAAAEKFDGKVRPGVYQLDATPPPADGRWSNTALAHVPAAPERQPILVLIHGTFSSTAGTFLKYWREHQEHVQSLLRYYGGHVYALEHATLGVSPIRNALDLVARLPDHARLHLLTHSRGGLVAEVLARACAAAEDDPTVDECFESADLEAQRGLLRDLINSVRVKKIQVDRVVRVACPARGTLLASRRLDVYLSMFRWAATSVGLPVVPGFIDLLGAVARQREAWDKLPGLASQVPDSALIQWIHAAADPLPGDLRVIAGDLQGDSLASWLKVLVSDAFYLTDHDLVVQTSSMYGGAMRERSAVFVRDAGDKVSHFNYFSNKRTAQAIVDGLTLDQPSDYKPIGPASYQGKSGDGRRGRPVEEVPGARPAVFVLPGIAGSNLAVDNKRVWVGWRLLNGLMRLAYKPVADRPLEHEPDGVTPDGPMSSYYGDLIEHLGKSHEVIEFAYDWRLPIQVEAARLSAEVGRALDLRVASGQPVRVLAHSMGGLVARTMATLDDGVWDRMMAHADARFLMLGTPNGGSWAPMQVLSGDDRFMNGVIALGAPLRDLKARRLMANFPGLIQMQANLLDPALGLGLEATWQELARKDKELVEQHSIWHRSDEQKALYTWGAPSQQVIDLAVGFRRLMDRQVSDERGLKRFAAKTLLVVGQASFTPDGYVLDEREGLYYVDTPRSGDGRVTLEKAMLPGVRTWVMDCEHGKLPSREEHFGALEELLVQGATTQLKTLAESGWLEAGRGSRGGGDAALLPPELRSRPGREWRAGTMPASDAQWRDEVDGGAKPTPEGAAVQALRVSVLNGNLKFSAHPLLIGHYRSVKLTGAERVIDRQIGGTMTEALQIGRYPDMPGATQVFVNRQVNADNPFQLPTPHAVIVVGLGPEGKLKGKDLTASVRQGVIAWAQRVLERSGGTPSQFELATTLIGSGGTGVSPGQSAQWIAQGVYEANLRLSERALPDGHAWPRCSRLQIVELYLDRASEAWRALRLQAEVMQGRFRVDDCIESATGALRRPTDASYRGVDYDMISAVSGFDAQGHTQIEFTLDTRRARAEVHHRKTQGTLLRELVRSASNDRNQDTRVRRTLFNLVVPVELEPFLGGADETLLELDDKTAAIPWELLDNPTLRQAGSEERPWAIRCKLLRKLRTVDFRARPLDAELNDDVLVIGDPDTRNDDPNCRWKYERLAGARKEARAVACCLTERGRLDTSRVRQLVSTDESSDMVGASEVINELMARCWRIVHIAGHGEAPEREEDMSAADRERRRPPARRGVVLSGGAFLGPDEIEGMRVVPELVFVNCCHLGAMASDRLADVGASAKVPDKAAFAAGVAEALIRIGVRCVVAAGWAVSDDVALLFAQTFYRSLLAGRRFIDAVADARRAAYDSHPDDNTWAAYQCYGDPDWRFVGASAESLGPPRQASDEFAGIASPLALANALETLAVNAQFEGGVSPKVSESARAQLREQLRYLKQRFGASWGAMGAVAEAFGLASAAAGDRREAIAWYQAAVSAQDGSASMKAEEQWHNLQCREAEASVMKLLEPWLDASAKAPGAKAVAALREGIENARRSLDTSATALLALAERRPTVERWSMVGSCWKRLALMIERVDAFNQKWNELAGSPEDVARALTQMAVAYRKADHLARSVDSPGRFYPALNWLAASLAVRPALDASLQPTPEEWLEIEQHLQKVGRSHPDFWSAAASVEFQLYRWLEAGAGAADKAIIESLYKSYADLHGRVSARDKWDSVVTQLRFLARFAVMDKSSSKEALDALQARVLTMIGSAS